MTVIAGLTRNPGRCTHPLDAGSSPAWQKKAGTPFA